MKTISEKVFRNEILSDDEQTYIENSIVDFLNQKKYKLKEETNIKNLIIKCINTKKLDTNIDFSSTAFRYVLDTINTNFKHVIILPFAFGDSSPMERDVLKIGNLEFRNK